MEFKEGLKVRLKEMTLVSSEEYGNVAMMVKEGRKGYFDALSPSEVEAGMIAARFLVGTRSVRMVVPRAYQEDYFEVLDSSYGVGEQFIVIQPLGMRYHSDGLTTSMNFTDALPGETVEVVSYEHELTNSPLIELVLVDRTAPSGKKYRTVVREEQLAEYIERIEA